MSFGENIQVLRKMHNGMTQEELAEKLNVSRQTISKWELDQVYPEIIKLKELCQLFNCSIDQILSENLNYDDKSYSSINVVKIPEFKYIRYAVISYEPEDDAKNHMMSIAKSLNIDNPEIIGWDFPVLSQEQINVYHMHGYCSALIIPVNHKIEQKEYEICEEKAGTYVTITIKDPFVAPFRLIPNAYKAIFQYMQVNKLGHRGGREFCFEKEYKKDGVQYMDIAILID